MQPPILTVLVASFVMIAAAGAAQADSVDGKWCQADGRRMEIDGPTIITPGGATLQGQYGRHVFLYQAPAGERDGGSNRLLRLRGEMTIFAYPADNLGAEPEVWERCTPVS